MGVFGEFVYGADIYGPEETIRADMLGDDVVVLYLNDTVVVNSAFLDKTNYTISVLEGSGAISIRNILPPKTALTTNKIIIELDKPTKGTKYQILVSNLTTPSNTSVTGPAKFIGRRTKLATMLRGLAPHWDTRPTSLLRGLLAAVSIEDDRIGGSRSDDLS